MEKVSKVKDGAREKSCLNGFKKKKKGKKKGGWDGGVIMHLALPTHYYVLTVVPSFYVLSLFCF